jgi:hypothetical protein
MGRGDNCERLHIRNREELTRLSTANDCLCGLVVTVPGYRSRGPGFYSVHYEIFWEVVGLERDPLSLVSTTEELFGRKSSGSGLENRDYDRRKSAALTTRHPLNPLKLSLTLGGFLTYPAILKTVMSQKQILRDIEVLFRWIPNIPCHFKDCNVTKTNTKGHRSSL